MPIDFHWMEENVILHRLYQDERLLLDEVLEQVDYATGDEIIHQGDPGGLLYMVRSGSAAITMATPTNNFFLGNVEEASLVGDLTFLDGGEATATVTAHSQCRLYRMDRDGYFHMVACNQPLVLSFFAYMLRHSSHVIQEMNRYGQRLT